MIIERPCTTCGISLEKGVKFVVLFDIVFGSVSVVIWGVLVHTSRSDKKHHDGGVGEDKGYSTEGDFNGLFIALLLLSLIQLVLSFVLLIGVVMRKVLVIYIWLLGSAVTAPTIGVLPKIYEMIVVYAYSEELASDAHGVALAEFQKLPYVCNIETQLYPPPAYGLKRTRESIGRKNTAFFHRKSIFMQVPPIFQPHRC